MILFPSVATDTGAAGGWVSQRDGAQKPHAHAQCTAALASPPFVNDRGQERVIAFSYHARRDYWQRALHWQIFYSVLILYYIL